MWSLTLLPINILTKAVIKSELGSNLSWGQSFVIEPCKISCVPEKNTPSLLGFLCGKGFLFLLCLYSFSLSTTQQVQRTQKKNQKRCSENFLQPFFFGYEHTHKSCRKTSVWCFPPIFFFFFLNSSKDWWWVDFSWEMLHKVNPRKKFSILLWSSFKNFTCFVELDSKFGQLAKGVGCFKASWNSEFFERSWTKLGIPFCTIWIWSKDNTKKNLENS